MIRMSEQPDMSGNAPQTNNNSTQSAAQSKTTGLNFNILDILMYLLANWYWIVLSILICVGFQWYKYSRTQFMYSRSATVMIKNAASTNVSQQDLMRFSATTSTNVSNEILQFKSQKLMHDVVKRLHAEVSYTIMDGLRQKELYTQSPVKVTFTEAGDNEEIKLVVTPLNQKQVKISGIGFNSSVTIPLNKEMKTSVGKLMITPTLYYSDKWFDTDITVHKMSVDNKVAEYRSRLWITQTEQDASILNIGMTDYSTTRADDIINMLITIYNEETIKDKNQIAVNTAKFINDRLVIIEKELGGVESEIEEYKRANEMIDINSTAAESMAAKQEYSSKAAELMIQLKMAQYIQQFLTDPTKTTGLIPANTGISDMNIESQINMYNTNKLKRDKLIENSSEKNPVVQELNNSLIALRQNIIRGVDNMIVNLNTQLNEARGRASNAQYRISNIPTQQRQMLSIERQQHIKEELYIYLLRKREENALTQATTETDARVLDPARGSETPVSPMKGNMLTMGFLVGLGIPGIILFGIAFFNTAIRSRKDIEDVTSVPFLGEIPKADIDKKNKPEYGIVVTDNGEDSVTEAFRIVRTNMSYMNFKKEDLQVITFSSFGPSAGKTFVCTNLAMSFVQTQKKVVLIDLDIRKRTLSHHFRHQKMGITTYLSSNCSIDDIIMKDPTGRGFDLITAGPAAPNPAELLLSEQLEQMIADLRTRYDYIFVDNVPVGVIADAAITNRIADLTIFVIRAGKVDRRMLPEIDKIYQSKQLRNMSLILNGVEIWKRGYGYGYKYGYSYHYSYGYGYSEYKKKKKSYWPLKKHKNV